MPRIAFLVSSASRIELEDGSTHPTGFWVEEALTAYELLAEAGAEVVVMTPDGRTPVAGGTTPRERRRIRVLEGYAKRRRSHVVVRPAWRRESETAGV